MNVTKIEHNSMRLSERRVCLKTPVVIVKMTVIDGINWRNVCLQIFSANNADSKTVPTYQLSGDTM